MVAAILVAASVVVALAVVLSVVLSGDDLPVESLPSSPARVPEPPPPRVIVEPLPYPVEVPAAERSEPSHDDDVDEEPPQTRRTRRRTRPTRRPSRPTEESEEAPVLLDVNAFDQQTR